MQDLPDPLPKSISNQADPNSDSANSSGQTSTQPEPIVTGQQYKEQEPAVKTETAVLEDMIPEIQITPELREFGVEKVSDRINLPADVKKMGVEALGPSQPILSPTQVTLPISDDKVLQGKRAKIMSSLFWLTIWCIKQLKRAHLHLKRIGGKIVREQD